VNVVRKYCPLRSIEWLSSGADLLAYCRADEGEPLVILLNFARDESSAILSPGAAVAVAELSTDPRRRTRAAVAVGDPIVPQEGLILRLP
jgi:hypothetical protein